MILFHGTNKANEYSIKHRGLDKRAVNPKHKATEFKELINIDNIEDLKQGDIDNVLEQFKPFTVPREINVKECVYFTIYEDYKKYWQPYYGNLFGVIVDSVELDNSKLYVLNNDTEILYEILNYIIKFNYYLKDNSNIEAMTYYTQRQNVIKWWSNLIPFNDYINNTSKYTKPNTWPYCYEVLYFGNVEASKLEFINEYGSSLW